MKEKVVFNWSTGKDSALALYKILQQPQYEVLSLLTSVSTQFNRVSMHGVRVELLEAQVKSIGIPLLKMEIPEMPTMEVYETVMRNTLLQLQQQGVTASVFGDIFLEDLRKYREEKLEQLQLKAVFPLWKLSTKHLINEFIGLGFKTIVTCVNETYLDKSFAGRVIDKDFINDLPANVDPCGENGEFHTFTFDGPIFNQPIDFTVGEVVHRTYSSPKEKTDNSYDCEDNAEDNKPNNSGFWYCDLLPNS